MDCEEKGRLTRAYQEATAKFAASVTELQQRMGVVSREEYERLQRASEQCRVKSELARLGLEHHIAEHRC